MTLHADVLRLERLLDERLPRPFLVGPPGTDLLDAARAWSAAVWASAERDGAMPIAEATIARGLEVGRRPVFICGPHRSGTTLVRNLLDGHPSLTVLPAEGTFIGGLQARLAKVPGTQAAPVLGHEWIRRLANPINRPPYWLLGRSDERGSPYVAFARALQAWWRVIEQRWGSELSLWPLVAVALAYGASHEDGTMSPHVNRWVEKTPNNERFLDLLWNEFPAAKVVHVVRHPAAVVASRKVPEQRTVHGWRNLDAVLRDLAVSYRVAAQRSASVPPDRYLLLRYEELVDTPRAAVARLAELLEIELLPQLLRPTVAGLPAVSNSSIDAGGEPGRIHAAREAPNILSRRELEHLAAEVGPPARALGYDLPAVGPWRAQALKLARRLRVAGRGGWPFS